MGEQISLRSESFTVWYGANSLWRLHWAEQFGHAVRQRPAKPSSSIFRNVVMIVCHERRKFSPLPCQACCPSTPHAIINVYSRFNTEENPTSGSKHILCLNLDSVSEGSIYACRSCNKSNLYSQMRLCFVNLLTSTDGFFQIFVDPGRSSLFVPAQDELIQLFHIPMQRFHPILSAKTDPQCGTGDSEGTVYQGKNLVSSQNS